MALAIGMLFVFLLRLIPALKRRPAGAYWGGALIALSLGFITLSRSTETVAVAALAGIAILLRHYLSIKKG